MDLRAGTVDEIDLVACAAVLIKSMGEKKVNVSKT